MFELGIVCLVFDGLGFTQQKEGLQQAKVISDIS